MGSLEKCRRELKECFRGGVDKVRLHQGINGCYMTWCFERHTKIAARQ